MNKKMFVAFAALCAVLLATQTASCEEEVKQPDELHVINPGSAFPVLVTDPNSPLLDAENRQAIRICIVSQCQYFCKTLKYRTGGCTSKAVCVCVR